MSKEVGRDGYRLAHTMIRVRDLETSFNFYCKTLGMKILRKTDYPDGKFTNAFMGLVGFIILIIISHLFEGNIIHQIKNIEVNGWLAVLYAGAIISIFGHMMMFYLYKYYPVGMVLPFYALFPVFGLILTFLIFGEIPTLIMVTGGIIVVLSVFMLQKIR